jgi:hypothetical protein
MTGMLIPLLPFIFQAYFSNDNANVSPLNTAGVCL